ncbi:MAG: hypothetical protein ABH857_03675 [Elusimicrobiota bacterium]
MSSNDFLEKVNSAEDLEIKQEFKDSYIIYNKTRDEKYRINKSSIDASDWENIYSVMRGREPQVLDGITRIVGYFSKTSNWNKSKLGELRDRRKGNYNI